MSIPLYIGVDGGATKSIVRVETETGELLGREWGGPASINNSVDEAWDSIYTTLQKILSVHDISLQTSQFTFHLGAGLAGTEIKEACQAFCQRPHPFKSLRLTSDSHIACLGAHGGADGAIIIVGTGVSGFQISEDRITQVGGWGFPHDDEGGGAWIGLEALKITLKWLDGRGPASPLSIAIFEHFENDLSRLVSWANEANSRMFAELAPIVVHQNDDASLAILQQAASYINQIGFALAQNKRLPCSLIGGIAPFLLPFLELDLTSRLSEAIAPPDAGAIYYVKKSLLKSVA